MFQSETLSNMGLSMRRGLFKVESEDEDMPLGSAKAEKGRLDALSAIRIGDGDISDWLGELRYGRRRD